MGGHTFEGGVLAGHYGSSSSIWFFEQCYVSWIVLFFTDQQTIQDALFKESFGYSSASGMMLKVADTSKFGPHIKFEIFTLGTSFIHS